MTIRNIERGASLPRRTTLRQIERALSNAGLDIIPRGEPSLAGGPGLRLRGSPASRDEGAQPAPRRQPGRPRRRQPASADMA
jgi:hypothetical protein